MIVFGELFSYYFYGLKSILHSVVLVPLLIYLWILEIYLFGIFWGQMRKKWLKNGRRSSE